MGEAHRGKLLEAHALAELILLLEMDTTEELELDLSWALCAFVHGDLSSCIQQVAPRICSLRAQVLSRSFV